MLKREWGGESNEKLLHVFIPCKTATLVPEFAVEDLLVGRTVALVPEFCSERPALGQNTLIMMIMDKIVCSTYMVSTFLHSCNLSSWLTSCT